MAYSDKIDTSLPAGGDDPAEADDNMRRIQAGFQEILAVEHNVDLTGTEITGDGGHTDITTTSIVNAGALANTGDLTINTDKFTIDAATGNVVVAGTLDIAGAAEITGVAILGDASLLKTSAAPTTDPMIANKKYVDDQNTSDHPAYSGGESHTDGSGLIIKSGYKATPAADGTITFGTAFPTGIVSVVATIRYNTKTSYSIAVGSLTKTGFNYYSSSSYTGFYWMAIGY